MEAAKIKPTGGLFGEAIQVTATPEEWWEIYDLLFDLAGDYLTGHSAAWELTQEIKRAQSS